MADPRPRPLPIRRRHSPSSGLEANYRPASSASVLAEAARAGTAPAAILIGEPDLILALGAAVAEELYAVRVPMVVLPTQELAAIRDGAMVEVGSDGTVSV